MTTLVLKSKSINDLKAMIYMAKRLGISIQSYSEDDIEDIAMSNAIKAGRKKDYISESVIMKTLKSNDSKVRKAI